MFLNLRKLSINKNKNIQYVYIYLLLEKYDSIGLLYSNFTMFRNILSSNILNCVKNPSI